MIQAHGSGPVALARIQASHEQAQQRVIQISINQQAPCNVPPSSVLCAWGISCIYVYLVNTAAALALNSLLWPLKSPLSCCSASSVKEGKYNIACSWTHLIAVFVRFHFKDSSWLNIFSSLLWVLFHAAVPPLWKDNTVICFFFVNKTFVLLNFVSKIIIRLVLIIYLKMKYFPTRALYTHVHAMQMNTQQLCERLSCLRYYMDSSGGRRIGVHQRTYKCYRQVCCRSAHWQRWSYHWALAKEDIKNLFLILKKS